MSNILKIIIGYVAQHKKLLAVVLVALLSVASATLSVGYVFRKLIDNGLGQNHAAEINNSIYLIIALIAVFAFGSFFRSYFINLIALKVVSKLKADTYRNLLKNDIVTFEDLKIGDIISRLSTDIETINGMIINFLSFFIRNGIMLIGAISLMFIQSPKLSLMVIIGIPVLLFPLLRLSKHVRKLSKKVLEEQSALASNVEETFASVRTLYSYNQQEFTANKFDNKITSYIKHASVRLRLRSMFFALAISVIAAAITGVIWIGSLDILSGSMSSGQMVSFIYYAIMVGVSAGGLAELFSEIQGPFAALERVLDLKNLDHDIKPSKTLAPALASYNIIFDKVEFSYPSRPDIQALKSISLTIEQGKFTGIVGRSGSGKSTLMQLLLKFYNHQSGKIAIGGSDIEHVSSDLIRDKVAYVEQYPAIFSGTIRSNIAFSKPDATEREIEKIAELCGISEFVKDLEQGLDTEIGERGVRISGGQKQRIAIARAVLYAPEILLLDEATSALDNESEKQILQNISQIMPGKTIISIAHRISSIEAADNILVIDQGELEASGKHSKLLTESETYSLLYREQADIGSK